MRPNSVSLFLTGTNLAEELANKPASKIQNILIIELRKNNSDEKSKPRKYGQVSKVNGISNSQGQCPIYQNKACANNKTLTTNARRSNYNPHLNRQSRQFHYMHLPNQPRPSYTPTGYMNY